MAEILQNQKAVGGNVEGLLVDSGSIFLNHKGIYKEGIEKRQTKLIKQISFIKPFLQEGEKILLVTTGCSPMSFIEQFLMGWLIVYIKRSVFVLTNRGIFHIPTKSDYTYRNSIAKILYADCQSLAMKGRALVVEFKNGKKEKFYYIAGKEKKKMAALLRVTSLEGTPSSALGKIHLCPRCAAELIEDKYICPNCRLEFKNRVEGKKISILYPGGGYFYTGHWWLGIGDAVAEVILLILVVASLVDILQGGQEGISSFVIFSVLLAFEKMETVYHLNHFIKEYIPINKEISPIIAVK